MRTLVRAERGIATMEFALLAPVITMMMFGFLELAWVMSARSALESSTMRAARKIAASDCPAQRQQIMTNIITQGMRHVRSVNDEPPQITTKSYASSFGDVGEPEPWIEADGTRNGKYDVGESYTDVNGNGRWDPDMGTSGSVGGANQVVSYTARFRVKPIVPFFATQFGDTSGEYPIEASTVIRNEPVFRNTGCPQA
jgi:hypothetical protein